MGIHKLCTLELLRTLSLNLLNEAYFDRNRGRLALRPSLESEMLLSPALRPRHR